jgi:hypothetical protein
MDDVDVDDDVGVYVGVDSMMTMESLASADIASPRRLAVVRCHA